MKQWFHAKLEGSYVGAPSVAQAGAGSRCRLQIYRAVLQDLRWIDEPPDGQPLRSSARVLWQAQIEHAHVTGVRGPGTLYEGPICDVLVQGVHLDHPTEHAGRRYGRITGRATGWLELPPPPAPPEITVQQQAVESRTAFLYAQQSAASESADPLTAPLPRDGSDVDVTHETPAADLARAETDVKPRPPTQLPAVALAVGLGVVLLIASGLFGIALWTLFVAPTLVARRFFQDVLRDSAFLRGVGVALVVLQLVCATTLLRNFSSSCPEPELWPVLVTVLLLFPAGVLPARSPVMVGMVSLALALAGASPVRSEQCAPSTRSSSVREPSAGPQPAWEP